MSDHTGPSAPSAPSELSGAGDPAVASEALVPTERAARYGKQLASHLGRRATTEWDQDAGRGSVVFSGGRGSAELVVEDDGLRMRVIPGPDAGPDTVGELEDVLGRHLVRFGSRDELVVRWTRADGTPGSEQRMTAEQG